MYFHLEGHDLLPHVGGDDSRDAAGLDLRGDALSVTARRPHDKWHAVLDVHIDHGVDDVGDSVVNGNHERVLLLELPDEGSPLWAWGNQLHIFASNRNGLPL